jgi:hypothetical protein
VGPDCYILQQQEQLNLPEELKQEGPDWYLDWTGAGHWWDLPATYSCNRSSTPSLRSWTLVGPDCYLLLQQKQHHLPEELDTGGT